MEKRLQFLLQLFSCFWDFYCFSFDGIGISKGFSVEKRRYFGFCIRNNMFFTRMRKEK